MGEETKNQNEPNAGGQDAPGGTGNQNEGKDQAKTYTEEQYNALQKQLDAVNAQLTDANKSIKSYKDMDIDSIKKSAEDWENKYKEAEKQRAEQEYSNKLDKFVEKQGCKNVIYSDYLKNQLKEKQLKFDGETLLGGEDVVKALKESCPDAFKTAEEKPEFVQSTEGGNKKSTADDMVRRVLGLK